MPNGAGQPWTLTGLVQKLLSKASIPFRSKTGHRQLAPDDHAFATYVAAHFDPAWYREAYPDVAAAGIDPLSHLMDRGLQEGRQIGPNLQLRVGADAKNVSSSAWQHFSWRGEAIALRHSRMSAAVLDQIRAQATHDPAIVAAGMQALPMLPRLAAGDLLERSGIDAHSILGLINERPEFVIMVPRLTVGEAEKYASDLIAALATKPNAKIWVFVTEQNSTSAGDWTSQPVLSSFNAAKIIFWEDTCGPAHRNPAVLARLMNVLRPLSIIAVDSRLGLDMIAKFGRGLSQYSRLYCTYFNKPLEGSAAPYGLRYPRHTAPFATALTDTHSMSAFLDEHFGAIPGPGIAVLPRRLSMPATDEVFASRLDARLTRNVGSPLRWVWISRADFSEDTEVLAALADIRSRDTFEVFGSRNSSLPQPNLLRSNIVYCGIFEEMAEADFSSYDGFLLASLVEGMPDAVLEISQHAIPMILADAVSLRDTFDDTAVQFVRHAEDPQQTAIRFSSVLDKVTALSSHGASAMLIAARNQALERHAPDVHLTQALKLFGAE